MRACTSNMWCEISRALHIWRRTLSAAAPMLLVVGSAVCSHTRPVQASCNLIPGTAKTFNATLGATNRPFAAPGEAIELLVRPCDAASVGLQ